MSRRLKSGGLASFNRAIKRRRDVPGNVLKVRISDKQKKKTIRTTGGNFKQKILAAHMTNLFNPRTRVFSKSRIISVIQSQADRNYIQRNIVTKGAIVLTENGKAKITSRLGKTGTINSVLVFDEEAQ